MREYYPQNYDITEEVKKGWFYLIAPADNSQYPVNYCWGHFTQAGFNEMRKTVNASEEEKIVSALGDLDVVTLIKEILRSDFHITKLFVSEARIGILTSGTIGTDRGLFAFEEEE